MIIIAAETIKAVLFNPISCVHNCISDGAIVASWWSMWFKTFCSGASVDANRLDRSVRGWRLPGRREAADHLSGLKIVNHPAVPTLNPRRFKVRRVFMASPLSRVLGCGLIHNVP